MMEFSFTVTASVRYSLDLERLIRSHLVEYLMYTEEDARNTGYYEDWQRPIAWAFEYLGVWDAGLDIAAPVDVDSWNESVDEPDYRWTHDDYEQLLLRLPEIDPEPSEEREEWRARQPGPGQMVLGE